MTTWKSSRPFIHTRAGSRANPKSAFASARRDALRRLLQEEDGEAGVPGVLVLVLALAPGAVAVLVLQEDGDAFVVPVVAAEALDVVEHAGALQGVHVVVVRVHREVLADPGHAGVRHAVLLEVAAEDVLVDHGGPDSPGRHGVV